MKETRKMKGFFEDEGDVAKLDGITDFVVDPETAVEDLMCQLPHLSNMDKRYFYSMLVSNVFDTFKEAIVNGKTLDKSVVSTFYGLLDENHKKDFRLMASALTSDKKSTLSDEERAILYDRYIKSLVIMDNTFARKVFEDERCVKELLDCVLDKELTVEMSVSQFGIFNLQGRSVIVDAWLKDKDGKNYAIEVQRKDDGAIPERARYISSLMDANALISGEDFSKLVETYVIFITENDVLGGRRNIYHIERMVEETNTPFNDRAHIIYTTVANVDTECYDERSKRLNDILHDFNCVDPRNMRNKVFRDRVMQLKRTRKGAVEMTDLVERILKDGEERGKEEMEKMNRLYAYLMDNGKDDEMRYAVNDESYRKKLMKEYDGLY